MHNYTAGTGVASPYQAYPTYGQYYGYGADYYAKTYPGYAAAAHAQTQNQTPYAGWYANYQPPAAAPATTTTIPGTGTSTPTVGVTAYAGASQAQVAMTPTPAPRVVANTLKTQQNGWGVTAGATTAGAAAAAAGASPYAATLPLHLRPGNGASATYFNYANTIPATPSKPGTPAPPATT